MIIGHDHVMLVGGQSRYALKSSIYKLECVTLGCSWDYMGTKLTIPRMLHLSFLVSDSFLNCSNIDVPKETATWIATKPTIKNTAEPTAAQTTKLDTVLSTKTTTSETTTGTQTTTIQTTSTALKPENVSNALLVITGISKVINMSMKPEVINFDDNKVCQIPPYPEPIAAASGAIIGSKLTICGGALPKSTSAACFYLGSKDQIWQQAGNLLKPRSGAASIETNGKLFITGGWNENDQFLRSTELFDRSTMQSTFGPDLPAKIAMHCMVKLNSSMAMIIGGMEGLAFTARTFYYSTTNRTFTPGPMLLNGRSHASCGVLKIDQFCHIVVTGGWNGQSILRSTEYLSLDESSGWKLGILFLCLSVRNLEVRNSLPQDLCFRLSWLLQV